MATWFKRANSCKVDGLVWAIDPQAGFSPMQVCPWARGWMPSYGPG
jgi:hypothetical protein